MKITIVENDFDLAKEVALLVPEISIQCDLSQKIGHLNHLVLVALIDGKMAGYKVGYERNSEVFYSWIGGVVPEWRKSGVGKALLDYQEDWAKGRGYRCLQVKSMNKYPEMLRFLIKNSYRIYGIEAADGHDGPKILFSKKLK